MTETTLRIRAGVLARICLWVRRRLRGLSDRVHAAGDERARRHGWQVTQSTGRFGFGARSYRDPRFDDRRRQLSAAPAAQADQHDHSKANTKEAGLALRILGRWVARPDNQGSPEAQPDVIPALKLDQNQANVMFTALEDAAALRREVIGNCPDCRSADHRVCTEHEGSWETAEEYDQLRWHLGNPCRYGEPDQDAGAATGRAPTKHAEPVEPGAGRDRGGWEAQTTAALEPSRAECPGGALADTGPAGNQIIGKNDANDYEPDSEAGE